MAGMKWYKVWLVVPYEPGAEAPSDREMGQECPVCTGAAEVTDEEYAEWKKEMEEPVELPFQ